MTKTIYTTWVALALREKGFKILRTRPNPNHPQFDCWDFEVNAEFEKALSDITRTRKN